MEEDIIDKLRAKEEEMEALINEAKGRAAVIKEDAVKKARELKDLRIQEIEKELGSRALKEEEGIKNEVREIEKEADAAIEELRKRAALNRDKAVKEVVRLTVEGRLP